MLNPDGVLYGNYRCSLLGCDLNRKLGKDDRFMGIIQLAIKTGSPFNRILEALAMGFLFKGKDEFGNMLPGDVEFHNNWSENPDFVIKNVCGFQDIQHRDVIKHLIDNLSGY